MPTSHATAAARGTNEIYPTTRLVFDALFRHLDQQARVVEVVAAQAEALATPKLSPEIAVLVKSLDADDLLESSSAARVELIRTVTKLESRQHRLAEWLQDVIHEARARREQAHT